MDAEPTPPSPDPATPTLEYSKRPHLAWVSRHARLLIVLVLLLTIGGSTWWYWQPLKRRIQWLYWSHQAAKHVMPHGAVISIVGPEAARLPTTNPDYLPRSPYAPLAATQPSASYVPVVYQELSKMDGRLQSVSGRDGPVIFIGKAMRPDGTPRLVVLTGAREMDDRYLLRSVGAAVLPLPGWFDPLPPSVGILIGRGGGYSGPPPQPATYLTGSLDPKDPSHIVIPYFVSESTTAMARAVAASRASMPGSPAPRIMAADLRDRVPREIGRGEIDVYLKNDDTLTFTVRGPGTAAVTTIAADPASIDQAAAAYMAQRGRRGGGPTTAPAGRGSARSRGGTRGN